MPVQATAALSPLVQTMKHLLYGFPEQPVDPELSSALASAIWESDLLPLLIFHMQHLEFEVRAICILAVPLGAPPSFGRAPTPDSAASRLCFRCAREGCSRARAPAAQCRKDVAQVVSSLLRKSSGSRLPTVELFAADPALMRALLAGYELPSIALNCGLIVREASRHEPLCRQLLHLPEFYGLFEQIESPLFEVASDAFTTFKDALTKHKALVAEFLNEQHERFFGCYAKLLTSGNYVTKRQSLKLLSELLLDRANFKVMTRYIASADDFKLAMLLLRDSSRTIQFEAFHVFKIFVANPNRPKPIVDILVRNREKLVAFLQRFQVRALGSPHRRCAAVERDA